MSTLLNKAYQELLP